MCDVPLITKGADPKFVATNHVKVILPYSIVGTSCSLQKSPTQDYNVPFNTIGSTTYEVLHSTYPKTTMAKMLYQYENPNKIILPIYIESHRELILEKGKR